MFSQSLHFSQRKSFTEIEIGCNWNLLWLRGCEWCLWVEGGSKLEWKVLKAFSEFFHFVSQFKWSFGCKLIEEHPHLIFLIKSNVSSLFNMLRAQPYFICSLTPPHSLFPPLITPITLRHHFAAPKTNRNHWKAISSSKFNFLS